MKKLIRILPVLAVAAFLAGCEGPCNKMPAINAPDLTSGSADFGTVASVGANLSAGFQSGGLVNRHQVRAFPALFAAQVGRTVLADGTGDFTFNGISNDGIPTLLQITSLSPLTISNAGRVSGAPQNQGQATDFHNLAVPGELALDMVDSTFRSVYATTYFNMIYRQRGLGVQQVIRRAPTFLTYEFGFNEVLGAYSSGGVTAVFPTENYVTGVRTALDQIHALLPDAKIAVCNVPNLLGFPFGRTFSTVTLSTVTNTPVALLGPGNAPLAPGDMILLTAKNSLAAGVGFPIDSYNYVNPDAPGTGTGLANSQVLDEAEQILVSTGIVNMNAALDSIVANRPWTVLVDLRALFTDLVTDGYHLGAADYTTAFVTGGLFSLDGIHPTDMTHAIACNALIDAVNAKWDATIPHLNISDYATVTSSRMRPAGGEAMLPVRIDGLEAGLASLRLNR
jgi:hypothetical protein